MSEGPKLVRDIMTTEVATLHANDRLSIANDVMSLGRIRHLPIVDDDGALVGVLSQRDLFRGALVEALGFGEVAKAKIMATLFIKELMTPSPETTTPDTSLAEAARVMQRGKIGCLLVVDDGHLVGILTEGDFVALHAAAD